MKDIINSREGFFIFQKKECFCAHLWEQGKRDNNEDSLVFWHFSKGKNNKIMAVICDGIGGLEKGEEASSYVVRQFANWFMTQGYKLPLHRQVRQVQQLCFQVHEEIKSYGKDRGVRMGTTMTCVFMDSKKIAWVHYGDCRLYLIRKRRVKVLTKEHTVNGQLERALGVGNWHLFQQGKLPLRKGDKILLCSDGLYRNLTSEDIKNWSKREIRSESQADRMLRQLLEIKQNMGERDNISALYFGYMKKEHRGSV